jgi:metal-responsive CopG/Arc/MetJ family transcriptional regulator
MANRTRKNLARNIPLSIDKDLLAAVDRVAGDRNETRSLVMRKAIQEGLPILKAGANADVLALDSELSADVSTVSKETKTTRNKIILEAIRVGLQSVFWRLQREKIIDAQDQKPEEAAMLVSALEQSERRDDPMSRQVRAALIERGALKIQLDDLMRHVPEAKRRADAIEKLTANRRQPGGTGGGSAWGSGLSTEEMEWQIAMAEKYGNNTATWPEDQKKFHAEWYDAMCKKYQHNISWPQDEVNAHYAELKAKMSQT